MNGKKKFINSLAQEEGNSYNGAKKRLYIKENNHVGTL